MKIMYKTSFTILGLLLWLFTFAQQIEYTQIIRGRLIDKDSQLGIPGATISVFEQGSLKTGTAADINGYFRIENIDIGKYTVVLSGIGYLEVVLSNIEVNSAKEVVLNIQMETSVEEIEAVVVEANRKNNTINKMATVSARMFSVEESERYAGSRGDPARMASNYAGAIGVDDSRNDIIVRGNSPLGLVYMLEGIEIPNPSHFGIAGSAGGPVSILNNKVLANSDFFTGAFPAMYGNSSAAIMDLNMRIGNNEKTEFTGQFGFLGTELTAEGPISKAQRSSYLINYRYSTLNMFSFLGIQVGTSAVPQYQDLSFKFNFPLKGNASLSFFGIGGTSQINQKISEQSVNDLEFYGVSDRDQNFGSRMGVTGLKLTKSFNNKTFAKITIAAAGDHQRSHHEQIYRRIENGIYITEIRTVDGEEKEFYTVDSISDFHKYRFNTGRIVGSFFLNRKINRRHVISLGVHNTTYLFHLHDSLHNLTNPGNWITRWNYEGTASLIRPYVMWKYRIKDNLVFNAGLHNQFFTLNNSASWAEPRVGLKWTLNPKQSLSLGFGVHTQVQPLYVYFYQRGERTPHNIDMDFTKNIHYVLGYDLNLSKNARIKVETYYQQLSQVPVFDYSSSYSLINQGSGYQRFFPDSNLINEGTGTNYGLEFTFEKFYSKKWFMMITASLYNSKYKGSDGIRRDTDYNGNYVLNTLGGKTFTFGKRSSLTLGSKITFAGNKRFGPVDESRTTEKGEIIFIDAKRNTEQFDPYFRIDFKINYRLSNKKVAHEIGLDIANATNRQNVFNIQYGPSPENPSENQIFETPQLGLLPIFFYRIDF